MFKFFTCRYFWVSISLRRCGWGGGWAIASFSFLSFSRWPGTQIKHRHCLYLEPLREYQLFKGCIGKLLHYRDDEREDDLERSRLFPRSFCSSPYLLYFFLERDFVFSCFTFLSGEFESVRPMFYIINYSHWKQRFQISFFENMDIKGIECRIDYLFWFSMSRLGG